MIGTVIAFVLSNVPLIGLILAFILAAFKRPFAKALTLYLLLLPVGVAGIWGFVFHTFAPNMTAQAIGWAPSPFQFEVAAANLGVGLAGLIGFFRKQWDFALAVAIMVASFFWGAAATHVYNIIVNHDLASSNAGIILWTDIIIPLSLILSLFFWKR